MRRNAIRDQHFCSLSSACHWHTYVAAMKICSLAGLAWSRSLARLYTS